MLLKRLIVCLDVRNGRVTKGVRFQGNVDVGDPVEMAARYCADGADEIVFYDITASAERRVCDLDMVARAARALSVPFTVGGGIRGVEDMRAALLAGADKVSLNSLAVQTPDILTQGAKAFGSQCVVLGMDAKRVPVTAAIPSGYEVVIHGGRTPTGRDALAWAKEAVDRGAGEICLNAIDTDGVRQGSTSPASSPRPSPSPSSPAAAPAPSNTWSTSSGSPMPMPPSSPAWSTPWASPANPSKTASARPASP